MEKMGRQLNIPIGPWPIGHVCSPLESLATPQAIQSARNVRIRQDGAIVPRELNSPKLTLSVPYYRVYNPKLIGLEYINNNLYGDVIVIAEGDNNYNLVRLSALDTSGNFLYSSVHHRGNNIMSRVSGIAYPNIIGRATWYADVLVVGRAMETSMTGGYTGIGLKKEDYNFTGQSMDKWKEQPDICKPWGTWWPLFANWNGALGIGSPGSIPYPNLRCVDAAGEDVDAKGSAYFHHGTNPYYLSRVRCANLGTWPPNDLNITLTQIAVGSTQYAPYKGIAGIKLQEGALGDVIFVGGGGGWGYWTIDPLGLTSIFISWTNTYGICDVAVSRKTLGTGESCKLYVLRSDGIIERYSVSWNGVAISVVSDNLTYNLGTTTAHLITCENHAGEDANTRNVIVGGDGYLVKIGITSSSWGTKTDLLANVDAQGIIKNLADVQRIHIHSSRIHSGDIKMSGDIYSTLIVGSQDGFFYYDGTNLAKLWQGGGPSRHKRIIPIGEEKVLLLDGQGAPMEVELKYDNDNGWTAKVNSLSIQHAPDTRERDTHGSVGTPGSGQTVWIVRRLCRLQFITKDGDNIVKEGPYTDIGEVIYKDNIDTHNFQSTIFKVWIPCDLDPQITHLRVLLRDERRSVAEHENAGRIEWLEDVGLHDGSTEWEEAYLIRRWYDGATWHGEWVPLHIQVEPEQLLRFSFGPNYASNPFGTSKFYQIYITAMHWWEEQEGDNSKTISDISSEYPNQVVSVNGVPIPRDRAPQCARWGAYYNDMLWIGDHGDIYWSGRGGEKYAFSALYQNITLGEEITEIVPARGYNLQEGVATALMITTPNRIYSLRGVPGIFAPGGSSVGEALQNWVSNAKGNLALVGISGRIGAPYPDAITNTPYGFAIANEYGIYLFTPNGEVSEISSLVKGLFSGGEHKDSTETERFIPNYTACLFYFEDWNGPHLAYTAYWGETPYSDLIALNNALLVYNFATKNWDGLYVNNAAGTTPMQIRSAIYNVSGMHIWNQGEGWRVQETIYGNSTLLEIGHLLSHYSPSVEASFKIAELQPFPSVLTYWHYCLPLVDISQKPENPNATILGLQWQTGKIHSGEENVYDRTYNYNQLNHHHHVPMGFWGNIVSLLIGLYVAQASVKGAVVGLPLALKQLIFTAQMPDNLEEPNVRAYGT